MILSILCEWRVHFTNRIPIHPFHCRGWRTSLDISYEKWEMRTYIGCHIIIATFQFVIGACDALMLRYSDTLAIWCKSLLYKWIYRHRIAIMSYNTVTVIVFKTFNFVWFDDNCSGFDNQTEPVSVCFCFFFFFFCVVSRLGSQCERHNVKRNETVQNKSKNLLTVSHLNSGTNDK